MSLVLPGIEEEWDDGPQENTMSLPPLFVCEPHIEDDLCYYETDEVLEYGRQCWNAAIEAVADLYGEYSNDTRDMRKLKIPASTVSQEP